MLIYFSWSFGFENLYLLRGRKVGKEETMAEQLTDEQARREAQKRFRERAEKKLDSFIKHAQAFPAIDGCPYPSSWREELKNIKILFEYSDAGASRFLAIADKLTSLIEEIDKKEHLFCQMPAWELQRFYLHSRDFTPLFQALGDGSEAFLRMAAKPRIIEH